MKNAQNLAQASSGDLGLLYTSAAMESQKFEKSNVMQLLNQHATKLATDSDASKLVSGLRDASNKSALDKTLEEFLKSRTEYNKTVLMKSKLAGLQKPEF